MSKEMDNMDGRIKTVGEDGQTYYVPSQNFKIGKNDDLSRLLAVGGLTLSAVLGGILAKHTITHQDVQGPEPVGSTQSGLTTEQEERLQFLAEEAELNAVGDFINENILRDLRGFPLIGPEEFNTERQEWSERLEEQEGRQRLPTEGQVNEGE